MVALYSAMLVLMVLLMTALLLPLRHYKSVSLSMRRTFGLAVTLVFLLCVFSAYQIFGSPGILPMMAARQQKINELRQSIVANSEAVKKDDKNIAAWIMLGQDFMETGQYSAATSAFRQTVLLSEGNPVLLMAYARAMIADEDGRINDASKKALEMVLLQDNSNAQARYYLAVRMLQDNRTNEAMAEMKALYKSLPADSPLKAMIDRQIGRK